MKKYFYTYYSYEEYGRGYIGKRECKCLPEEDIKYFGSFKDKTFKPTQKIILKDDYRTREEALDDEIILQRYYKVVENPHFVNKAYQTSTKFCYTLSSEQARAIGKKYGKIGGKKTYELGVGVHARTPEQMREHGKKTYELGVGVHGLTKEQRSEYGRKVYKLGRGIHAQTPEQKIEYGKIGGKKTYELGVGVHGLTKEQRSEYGKIGGKIGGKIAGKIIAERTAREFSIVSPNGEVIHGRNLTRFTEENNLDRSTLRKVMNGKYKQHRGYTRYNDN